MSQNQQAQPKESAKEQQAKAKAQRDEYFKQFVAHKNKMMPLIKFLKKNGLKFKHAKVHDEAVEYFRVDELNYLVEDKRSVI